MKFFIQIKNQIENNTSIFEDDKITKEQYIKCTVCQTVIGIKIKVIKQNVILNIII